MKNIFEIVCILLFLGCLNQNLLGQAPCITDDANPQITGMNFDVPCVAENETTFVTVDWAMISSDGVATAPIGSWQILICMDAVDPPRYTAVNGLADINGPMFNWTWDPVNNCFRGTNSVDITYDISDPLNPILPQGSVEITVTGMIENSCTAILSNANVVIVPSFLGGCPAAFANQIADDSQQSNLGVSQRCSVKGLTFLDNFADGTQGNQAGDGTGSDVVISGIPVTLLDCGPDGVCNNTDDGPSRIATTLTDGTYCFDGLAYSNYQVEFGMNDGTTVYDEFTSQDVGADTDDSDATSGAGGGTVPGITLNSGNLSESDVDAGLFQYATISGTLYNNNDGTNGTNPAANVMDIIVVTYCNNPTVCDMTTDVEYPITTDGSGNYTIPNVIPGVVLEINATTYNTFEEGTVINGVTYDLHSGGSIIDQNFALPVVFTSFEVYKMGRNARLVWITEQEINNDYFDVQRSADGINFTSIGRVNGAGTTFDVNNYEFVDNNILLGINYYRLNQIDYDGNGFLTEIKSVRFDNHDQFKLEAYPNPTRSVVNLDSNIDLIDHHVSLYNTQGKLVYRGLFKNKMTLDMSILTPGVYTLKINNGNGKEKAVTRLIRID